jgi:hypothetical protein
MLPARYRLTALLLVWRMLFKFERGEILATLQSMQDFTAGDGDDGQASEAQGRTRMGWLGLGYVGVFVLCFLSF